MLGRIRWRNFAGGDYRKMLELRNGSIASRDRTAAQFCRCGPDPRHAHAAISVLAFPAVHHFLLLAASLGDAVNGWKLMVFHRWW
jgi:hypothetical protein